MTLVSSWFTSARNSKENMGVRAPNESAAWKQSFLTNKSPYRRNGARSDHSHNDGLIGSGIHAFDWYQNHRPWMTLNGRNALWFWKDASFGAHCTNLNEVRPKMSAAKCRSMTIVSGNNKLFIDIWKRFSDYCHQTGVGWLKSTNLQFSQTYRLYLCHS